MNINRTDQKRIVIIGAGFGGIELVKGLRNSNFQIVIFDKNNYHTFQPLLYQVATCGLEADNIAYPVRRIFRKDNHVHFRMADVIQVIPDKKIIQTSVGSIEYVYLVIATGSQSNYFNLAPVQHLLMPMKSISDALDLRSFILQNLENAIVAENNAEEQELLNIALVGGGATGVELAGALAEMKRYVFPKDYPGMDISQMRIALYEAAPRVLSAMSDEASSKALQYLEEFGVEVHLNTSVESYDGHLMKTKDGQTIPTDTVIWTAGVKGNFPLGFGDQTIVAGNRLSVNKTNQIDHYESIFAIGDAAAMIDENHPKGHPMLAQVAIQQGKLLAKNLMHLVQNEALEHFTYVDKGSMATVGRIRAVADLPKRKFQGIFAWFLWSFVHIFTLVGFRNKFKAFFGWTYSFFTYDRAMRLIIYPYKKNDANKK